jgi:YggT family protein
MILWANFLQSIAAIFHLIFRIYILILFGRVLMSWIQIPSLYSLAKVLYALTEPVLKPIRRFVPPYKMGGLDISPMILIILILCLDSFLVRSLSQYARLLVGPG